MSVLPIAKIFVVIKRTVCYALLGISWAFMVNRANAQNESYSDVLLVINVNSAISDSIGSYFALSRNIPSSNIARINVPSTEEIDSLQFENLRGQIEQIILTRNLKNQINYIVTTKGIPMKVLRSNNFTRSSVESELALILGIYAKYIGGDGSIYSPYCGQSENFSHAKYDIYLVTRLDGYNFADVKGIIDRASVASRSNISDGKFILDEDPLWNSAAGFLNSNMNQASNDLQSQNIKTVLDTTSSFLMYQTGVLGYASWGSNDHDATACAGHAIPCNSYLPGAIAETYVSTSARSFSVPQAYGQSLIGDLVKEGVTGVIGYVYEPYAYSMADVEILFPMYAAGYTLAESYFSASPCLSWMDVVIGDPKCRLNTSRIIASVLSVDLISFTASAHNESVELTWSTACETDNYGFEIQRTIISSDQKNSTAAEWQDIAFVIGNGTSNVRQNYSFSDNVGTGSYLYRLKQIDHDGVFCFSSEVKAVVQLSAGGYELGQNFPNPFNPSTTISYTIPTESHVTLLVFNTAGQKVAELVNRDEEAGSYNVRFDASGLASGIYLYRIQVGDVVKTKKLALMR